MNKVKYERWTRVNINDELSQIWLMNKVKYERWTRLNINDELS